MPTSTNMIKSTRKVLLISGIFTVSGGFAVDFIHAIRHACDGIHIFPLHRYHILQEFVEFRQPAALSPATAETRLRSEAADLIERNFQGLGTFKGTSGKVVWSDSKQQGFMTLSGIPVNDPKKAQYQLWIVDPKRDEAPVDGGVFDIPTDGLPVVVPIVAKLSLTNPQAFVITLEQPGGVVKSKQEQVVALAKN